MLPVLGWKIYRADNSVWNSSAHTAQQIPDGIQVVIFYHEPPYRTLAYGDDSYTVDGHTLTGVWMDEAAYYQLVNRALADEVWP
jgi:hypothetical protein